MGISNKIQMIISSAKLNNRKMAGAFHTSENTAAAKFQRGIVRIDDLIRICDYCDAKISIETKEGVIINLSLEDLEEGSYKSR